jgi:hypothetical protein
MLILALGPMFITHSGYLVHGPKKPTQHRFNNLTRKLEIIVLTAGITNKLLLNY